MRLIHTSDVRLDASYAGCGLGSAFGRRRREGLRAVLRALLNRAATWPADAVLIAGNLFDVERIEPATVRFLQESFESVGPVPIFIAPGDRDPFIEDSPYALYPWPDNVTIFREADWRMREVEDARLVVHGFGDDGSVSRGDCFARLSLEARKGWSQVALACLARHADAAVPFDTACLTSLPLDYVALGLGSVVQPVTVDGGVAVYCSGAPEGHGFDETGLRHYLEVEIDAERVRVTPAVSSRAVFERVTLDCAEVGEAGRILDVLASYVSVEAGRCLLELTFGGACLPELRRDWRELQTIVESAFASVVLYDDSVPADGERPALAALVRGLREEMRNAPDPPREAFVRRALQLGASALCGAPLGEEGTDEG
ncbi:MAG TPA: hypothetical protein PLO37_04165 [Candidatus Hydrogenedentes bacterium]|nr:hypothetical protein [Candidatus Hydrogenedentota bacterium]HPG66019.1 hypothetical protein [Candidatus Hydrogenedentota bacterium]